MTIFNKNHKARCAIKLQQRGAIKSVHMSQHKQQKQFQK